MPAIEHVFLDLDGTLTDPAPGIVASFQHVAETFGRPRESAAALKRFIGPPLPRALAMLLGTDDAEQVERAVACYRERFAVHGMFDNAVVPGVVEALSELSTRGFRLHVATSKAQLFAERIVQRFDLARHIEGVYGAELRGGRSEKHEVLAAALAGAGASPKQAVMVGDRHHDIEGARVSGMPSIGVLWGYGSLTELASAKPDRIVIAATDLPDVVSELSEVRAS